MKTIILNPVKPSQVLVHDAPLTLEAMQTLVGGYIALTVCDTPDGRRQMIVNEDGIRLRLPENQDATVLHVRQEKMLGVALVPLDWEVT